MWGQNRKSLLDVYGSQLGAVRTAQCQGQTKGSQKLLPSARVRVLVVKLGKMPPKSTNTRRESPFIYGSIFSGRTYIEPWKSPFWTAGGFSVQGFRNHNTVIGNRERSGISRDFWLKSPQWGSSNVTATTWRHYSSITPSAGLWVARDSIHLQFLAFLSWFASQLCKTGTLNLQFHCREMHDLTLHVTQALGCFHFPSSGLHPPREQVIKQGQNYLAEPHTGTTLHSQKILLNLWRDCMNTGWWSLQKKLSWEEFKWNIFFRE